MPHPFNIATPNVMGEDIMLGEVVLIGKGPGFEKAPLYGSGVTTWGVNDAVGHRQCDVCFWMDRRFLKDSDMDRVITEAVNLNKTKMYSTQVWEDIPTSERYPVEEVSEFVGLDYFGDSCSYMIALAIYQGYKEITTYGFNYAWGSNYVHEKPCVEFWLGFALAHGCTLNICGEVSDLLETKPKELYAFQVPEERKRTGVRMAQKFPPVKEKDFEFNIGERVSLMQILPTVGDYETLKASQSIHSKTWFKDEESKTLNLRQVEDENGRPFFMWDDNDIGMKTITLSESEQRLIQLVLSQINTKKKLTKELFSLYSIFFAEN